MLPQPYEKVFFFFSPTRRPLEAKIPSLVISGLSVRNAVPTADAAGTLFVDSQRHLQFLLCNWVKKIYV